MSGALAGHAARWPHARKRAHAEVIVPLCKCGWQGIPTRETADAWAQFDRHKDEERARRGDRRKGIGRRRQYR